MLSYPAHDQMLEKLDGSSVGQHNACKQCCCSGVSNQPVPGNTSMPQECLEYNMGKQPPSTWAE
eukprot:6313981-Karenia_brevis.AAC.1